MSSFSFLDFFAPKILLTFIFYSQDFLLAITFAPEIFLNFYFIERSSPEKKIFAPKIFWERNFYF